MLGSPTALKTNVAQTASAKFSTVNTLRPMFRAIYNLGMPLRLKSCALNSLDFYFFITRNRQVAHRAWHKNRSQSWRSNLSARPPGCDASERHPGALSYCVLRFPRRYFHTPYAVPKISSAK
jgi:hypothetical protein